MRLVKAKEAFQEQANLKIATKIFSVVIGLWVEKCEVSCNKDNNDLCYLFTLWFKSEA